MYQVDKVSLPPHKKKYHVAGAVTKFTVSLISLSTAATIPPYSSALRKVLGFSNSAQAAL
jgi:hypothetical protein